MLSILSRLLWFVLAGFILGFAASTLWEWYYYRGKRIAANVQRDSSNRRIFDLEEELQRKDALLAELNHKIDLSHQDRAETPSSADWDFSRARMTDIGPASIAAVGTDANPPRQSTIRPDRAVDNVGISGMANVNPEPLITQPATTPQSASVKSVAVHSMIEREEAKAPSNPRDRLVTPPSDEGNGELISLRRGPARPHYSEAARHQPKAQSDVSHKVSDTHLANQSQVPQSVESQIGFNPSPDPFVDDDDSDVPLTSVSSTEVRKNQAESLQEESKSVRGTNAESANRGSLIASPTKSAQIEQEPVPQPTVLKSPNVKSARNPSKQQSVSRTKTGSSATAKSKPKKTRTSSRKSGKQSKSSYPDDLTQINGIGPVFSRRLYEAGICTWHQLGQAKRADLAEITQTKDSDKVDSWKRQATALAKENNRRNAVYAGPTPDDFEEITGIKSRDVQILYKAGIVTYDDLGRAKPEQIEDLFTGLAGAGTKDYLKWIHRAQELQA